MFYIFYSDGEVTEEVLTEEGAGELVIDSLTITMYMNLGWFVYGNAQ